MKIMVDLDRTVFDCPSLVYYFGNMTKGESNLDKELKYSVVDTEKSKYYKNLLFFIRMSHAKNYVPVRGVVETLDKWYEKGIEVTFVSSRVNFKSFHKATAEWFDYYGIKYKGIVFECNNKAEYGKQNGFDMIVDDTFKNCTDCKKVGITPIWIRTKYNSKMPNSEGMYESTNWLEVDKIVMEEFSKRKRMKNAVVLEENKQSAITK